MKYRSMRNILNKEESDMLNPKDILEGELTVEFMEEMSNNKGEEKEEE